MLRPRLHARRHGFSATAARDARPRSTRRHTDFPWMAAPAGRHCPSRACRTSSTRLPCLRSCVCAPLLRLGCRRCGRKHHEGVFGARFEGPFLKGRDGSALGWLAGRVPRSVSCFVRVPLSLSLCVLLTVCLCVGSWPRCVSVAHTRPPQAFWCLGTKPVLAGLSGRCMLRSRSPPPVCVLCTCCFLAMPQLRACAPVVLLSLLLFVFVRSLAGSLGDHRFCGGPPGRRRMHSLLPSLALLNFPPAQPPADTLRLRGPTQAYGSSQFHGASVWSSDEQRVRAAHPLFSPRTPRPVRPTTVLLREERAGMCASAVPRACLLHHRPLRWVPRCA